MRVVIIGGGLSGLASAFRIQQVAREQGVPLGLTLLEANDRLGGKIFSDRAEGYVVERGPNGWLDSKPGTVKLVADLGLEDKVVDADEAAKRRFLFSGGGLKELPGSAGAFFRSPILPLAGKLRICLEPFGRRGPADETLADFGRRRLGHHAVERLLDPMVKGIFAGDVETLSVAAAFPAVKQLEQEHGGLIRGMFAKARARKREAKLRAGQAEGDAGAAKGGATGPGGTLHSLNGGVSTLIEALAAQLQAEIRTEAPVKALRAPASADSAGGHWAVELASETLEAELVVLAIPAPAAAELLAPLDEALAEPLRLTPYASVAVVATGFPRAAIGNPLDGFGYLIPSRERRRILGSLWSSSIYPGHRAPSGHVLLRTLVGGARQPELAFLDDQAMMALVREELEQTMGLRWVSPTHLRIVRWPAAIPQYVVGHLARVQAFEARLKETLPGLLVTGNHLHGVGMNDCTADAERIAAEFEGLLPARSAA